MSGYGKPPNNVNTADTIVDKSNEVPTPTSIPLQSEDNQLRLLTLILPSLGFLGIGIFLILIQVTQFEIVF
jgi:hypothetical protein